MATYSSILAWRTPWTEKPGRLYSPWGRGRVRHDLATIQQQISVSIADSFCSTVVTDTVL